METVIRKYLREELTDRNSIQRATRQRLTQQVYQFIDVDADRPGLRTDVWPELTPGCVENAVNLKFMHALRSASEERSAAFANQRFHDPNSHHSRGRSSVRSPSPAQRLLAAHIRPVWNADTRHVDRGVDPLQKCLGDALKKHGFDQDYATAKRTLDVVRRAELERLKQGIAQRKHREAHEEFLRELRMKWDLLFGEEQQRRDILLRGERTIRIRIVSEFRSTLTMSMELSEFNARKRLFKLFLHQLDELKVMEREEHVEQQLFEKLVKQRELEALQKQREVELRKRRADEVRQLFYTLITDEIHQRENIVQAAANKLSKMRMEEAAARDVLLRFEILESIVYEELLQRQLVTETRNTELGILSEKFLTTWKSLVEQQAEKMQRSHSERLQREFQTFMQHCADAQHELCRVETLQRSDVTGLALKTVSETLVLFHAKLQQLRMGEREQRSRKEVIVAAAEAFTVLQQIEQKEQRAVLLKVAAREELARAQRAKEETDMKIRQELERRAREDVERKAKQEAEAQAKLEAERNAKQEAQLKAKQEAERKAQQEAELKAKQELERKAKEEAETKLQLEAEARRVAALRDKVLLQNRPFLGVTLAEHVDPPSLVVDSLFIDGPAETAGVRLGDILTAVETTQVSNFAEMRDAVRRFARMGDWLSITIRRNSATNQISDVEGAADVSLVSLRLRVLTADKEFAELDDIFFDVDSHARISASRPTSTSASPNTNNTGSAARQTSSNPATPSKPPSVSRRT